MDGPRSGSHPWFFFGLLCGGQTYFSDKDVIESFRFGSRVLTNPVEKTPEYRTGILSASVYVHVLFEQSLTSDEESVFNYGEDATYPLSSK